jgi:hypothetical protein
VNTLSTYKRTRTLPFHTVIFGGPHLTSPYRKKKGSALGKPSRAVGWVKPRCSRTGSTRAVYSSRWQSCLSSSTGNQRRRTHVLHSCFGNFVGGVSIQTMLDIREAVSGRVDPDLANHYMTPSSQRPPWYWHPKFAPSRPLLVAYRRDAPGRPLQHTR